MNAKPLRRDQPATAARSRSPTRYRGPVRMRASATPSRGSSAARAYARTSTTSGRWISPARFTNSAGTSLAPNASCSASNRRCVRHRTVMSLQATPSAWSFIARSAIPSASATSCSYWATSTCPWPLRSHGRSSLSGIGPLVGRQGVDHPVGGLEDPRARAEVRVQRELLRLRAVGARELRAEAQQVPQAGAPPRVDVLIGVADRGHRVPAAEDRAHQDRLRVVRVLVLVEQDGAEAPAVGLADLRVRRRDPDGVRDLIAEVDHAELRLDVAEHPDGPSDLDPLLRRGERVRGLGLAQHVELALDVLDDLLGLDEMVLQLFVEVGDVPDDRRLPARVLMFERHPVQDPRRDLGPLGLAEHPLAGLEPDQHPVALEHLGRERVVVRDLGLLALVELERSERSSDLQDQVLRGLVRERQAQHVARHHARVVGLQRVRSRPSRGRRRGRPSPTSCPNPAPATTTDGSSGHEIARHCSARRLARPGTRRSARVTARSRRRLGDRSPAPRAGTRARPAGTGCRASGSGRRSSSPACSPRSVRPRSSSRILEISVAIRSRIRCL